MDTPLPFFICGSGFELRGLWIRQQTMRHHRQQRVDEKLRDMLTSSEEFIARKAEEVALEDR